MKHVGTSLLTLIFSWIVVGSTALGATIYVDAANQGGTEDGTSWATAWGTIAEGRSDLAVKNGASPGDHTVLVKGGAYYEEAYLTSAHSGTGEAGRNTIKSEEHAYIRGPSGNYGFEFSGCDYVTIDGFSIYARYRSAVYASGSDNITIRNCDMHSRNGDYHGIQFSGCASPIVENCTLWNCAEGIFLYTAPSMATVRNCIIAASGIGLHERGVGFSVSNCVFYGNGIHWYEKSGQGYCFTEESMNASADGTNIIVANPGFFMASGLRFAHFYTNTVCATAADDGGFVGAYQASEVTYHDTRDRTFYVDDAIGDDSYTVAQAQNEATPWKTIGNVSTNAVAGDTVIVKSGTYDLGAASLSIYGGGTYDDVLCTNVPLTYRAETPGSVTIQSSAQSIVWINRAAGLVFDGFNVNNLGVQATYDYGLRLDDSAGCVFRNVAISNMAGTSGYAVHVFGGGGHELINVDLIYNNGYGLYINAGGCIVTGSRFHDNRYGLYKSYPTSLIMRRSCIYNNTSYGGRNSNGYAYTGANYTRYENCLVYGNLIGIDVQQQGVGYANRPVTIYNCVVYSNRNCGVRNIANAAKSCVYNSIVANSPYGVYEGDANSEAYIRNSCIWNNSTNFYDEGTTVLSTAEEINAAANCWSNVVADPLFFNADSRDYRINRHSPCVDAGQDLSVDGITNDFYGNARPRLEAYDMGIYEAGPEGTVIVMW